MLMDGRQMQTVMDTMHGNDTELRSVKEDVAAVKTDVAAVKTDIAAVKTDTAQMKEQFAEMVAIMEYGKSGMRVLGGLGTALKWMVQVVAPLAALWIAVQKYRSGN